MKVELDFIPDSIIFFRKEIHVGLDVFVESKIFGDDNLYRSTRRFMYKQVEEFGKNCILFIQKETLKTHLIPYTIGENRNDDIQSSIPVSTSPGQTTLRADKEHLSD